MSALAMFLSYGTLLLFPDSVQSCLGLSEVSRSVARRTKVVESLGLGTDSMAHHSLAIQAKLSKESCTCAFNLDLQAILVVMPLGVRAEERASRPPRLRYETQRLGFDSIVTFKARNRSLNSHVHGELGSADSPRPSTV